MAIVHREKRDNKNISTEIIKRENTIISILINNPESYKIIKEYIKIEDFKYEINKKIIEEIYLELDKENTNLSVVLNHIEDEELQSHLTEIMAEDYGITDNQKAIEDILQKYERERLEEKRDSLLEQIKSEQDTNRKKELSKELNDIILQLVKIR